MRRFTPPIIRTAARGKTDMKSLRRGVTKGLAGLFVAAALFQPQAAQAWTCVRAEEIHAFTLRNLQSALMVAALSCNQRDAYNGFMTRFQSPLADGGHLLTAYFNRTGGGKIGLNRYVTEVANNAGLDRASDPQAFCTATWNMFLDLEQSPEKLHAMADIYTAASSDRPPVCTVAEDRKARPAKAVAPHAPATKPAMAKASADKTATVAQPAVVTVSPTVATVPSKKTTAAKRDAVAAAETLPAGGGR